MENWRKWLGLQKDPPADGMKPIDPKVYDVHAGGAESQLPLLNAPDEAPPGAPIKNRPALSIDHPQGAPPDWSIDKLNRNVQDLRNSDAGRWGKPYQEIVNDLASEWDVQFRELTKLESDPTLDIKDVDRAKERLEDFRKFLARADTVDIDLFHMHRELNDIEGSIRALKTRS